MIVHEVEDLQNAHEARVVTTSEPERHMGDTAHGRHSMRDIVTAIRHAWTVVCGETLKGLEKAPSLH